MYSDATVYVVDDDYAIRDSIDFLLSSAGLAVQTFISAMTFMDALPDVHYGCVITDIRMPGMDGLELLKVVRSQRPRLPVIVMTGHGEVPLAVQAMKLGAADFLEKPFEEVLLLDTIREALAEAAKAMDQDSASAEFAARIATLSPRERQVMHGLVAGRSNKSMAIDHAISPRTVEVYRANVMAKMKVSNLSDLVRIAVRAGVTRA